MSSTERQYYRVAEVRHLLGLPVSTLRFWEQQFRQIKPHRTPGGQRLYRREDLHCFQLIKKLLHDDGLTIAGAQRALSDNSSGEHPDDMAGSGRAKADTSDVQSVIDEMTRCLAKWQLT